VADLLSHLLVNHLVGSPRLRDRALTWFVSGAVVPDLAARVPRMGLHFAMNRGWVEPKAWTRVLGFGVEVAHVPVGVGLICLAVVALVPAGWLPVGGRRGAFGWLCGGALLHLAVDLLQAHITPAYALLWPFSERRWEVGCMSTEASLFAIPALVGLVWLRSSRRFRTQRATPAHEDRPPTP
jgi:hypothetical protein